MGKAAELKRHAGTHDSNAAVAEPPKKRAKTDAAALQEATSSAAPDRPAKGPPKKRAETDAASQEATSSAAADATEQVQQQQNNHMRSIHTYIAIFDFSSAWRFNRNNGTGAPNAYTRRTIFQIASCTTTSSITMKVIRLKMRR